MKKFFTNVVDKLTSNSDRRLSESLRLEGDSEAETSNYQEESVGPSRVAKFATSEEITLYRELLRGTDYPEERKIITDHLKTLANGKDALI